MHRRDRVKIKKKKPNSLNNNNNVNSLDKVSLPIEQTWRNWY